VIAPDQRAVGDAHDLGRIVDRRRGGVDGGRELERLLLDQRGEDRVLALEVVVEGPEAEIGRVGDLVDPGGVHPLAREDRARAVEQTCTGLGLPP
jgi:hypothetical protein